MAEKVRKACGQRTSRGPCDSRCCEKEAVSQIRCRRQNKLTDYRESDKAAFQHGILPRLRTALAPIDSQEAPELEDESTLEVACVAAGHQEYIVEITQLIRESYELVKTFDGLVKREEEIPSSRLRLLEWDTHKDEEAILSTVKAGRRVAARDVDSMLADRYNEVRGRSNLTREDEQQGRMLLSKGEEDHKESRDSMGWGNVAADARKAVHKLQKVGLPQGMAQGEGTCHKMLK